MTETKVCKKCGIEKFVSDFGKSGLRLLSDGTHKQYYKGICKKCVNVGPQSRKDNIDPKPCSQCGVFKPLSEYGFDHQRQRYRADCKACKYKQRVKFRSENPEVVERTNARNRYRWANEPGYAEKQRETNRKSREIHGEKYLKKQRERYANDEEYRNTMLQKNKDLWKNNEEYREKRKRKHLEYYKENYDKIRKQNREYVEKNKEKIQRIGRFLKFWWPSLLAGFALFFTPIGGLVAGTVGILTTALPLLVGLIAKYPILAAALAAGGLAAYFGLKSKGEGSVDNNSANQFDINQTESGGNTGKFNPIEETSKNKTEAMKNLENASDGGTFRAPMFNQGGTVAGSGNEDSVPAMLRPREVVIPASEGGISKTPIIAPKVRGVRGGNITPSSTLKMSNTVVLPPIRKEKPKKEVREGSTIPTFQISSNANSRQYTLMGMGLEGMV